MSAVRALEVERTYDVPDGTELPDLDGLAPGTGLPEERPLSAVYWDTEDLRLRRARVTLRHRAGGPDGGWHLKLPSGEDREEVRVPGALEDGVPEELAAQVRGLVRRAPLVPVVRLRTDRTARVLQGGDGRQLVEVVDDVVEAVRLRRDGSGGPDGPPLRWREWEVELVAGPRALLDEVEQRLRAAGAVPSPTPSKLGRVLPLPPVAAAAPGTAGAVVQRVLREQRDALLRSDLELRRDLALRQDLPDSLRRTRVAARRLGSSLRVLAPLLDPVRARPLRRELRWLTGALSRARDAEVVHARLLRALEREPAELLLGPVRATVDEVLGAAARDGRARARAALDDDRWLDLLEALDALAADPPLTERAARSADRELVRLVRRAWRRLEDRAVAAEEVADLHAVRRRVRALRDACQALAPELGKDARRLARALRGVQDELGALQDAAVTQEALLRLAAASARAGRNGFAFGRWHALEQARADRAVRAWERRRTVVPAKAVRWVG